VKAPCCLAMSATTGPAPRPVPPPRPACNRGKRSSEKERKEAQQVGPRVVCYSDRTGLAEQAAAPNLPVLLTSSSTTSASSKALPMFPLSSSAASCAHHSTPQHSTRHRQACADLPDKAFLHGTLAAVSCQLWTPCVARNMLRKTSACMPACCSSSAPGPVSGCRLFLPTLLRWTQSAACPGLA
jgi:hypothetical protein